jgi:hypothetical protein
MAEVTTEDLQMRQFLLGTLGENERGELEQRVLAEVGIRDKLSMAEDDLIEEYLEGSLKGEEREEFLRQFLSIPHQRDKLRIAKSLRRFARTEADIDIVPIEPGRISKAGLDTVSNEPLDTVSTEPQVLPFRRKLLMYGPIAAVLLVAVTVGLVWYAKYRRTEIQRQAIERELAQLNISLESIPPADQRYTLILPPTSTANVVTSIPATSKEPILELWLLPKMKQTERYNALLQKVGSHDQFQISNLRPQDRVGGKTVRLRISTRLLAPGIYRVELNGLSADGKVVETDEYSFNIE